MPKTSEEEILKLTKKIVKYHDRGNTSSMSEALSALRRLPMTVEILKSTQVGKKLNQMRQTVTDKEVKQQIRNLIKHWKSIASTNETSAPSPVNNRAASDDKEQNNSSDPIPAAVNNITGPNVQKQMSDIPLQMTGDVNRDKMREMFAKNLKKCFEQVYHQRCNECAENLETELHKLYSGPKLKTQFMSKLSNLKDPKNPQLRTSFIKNILSAEEIAKMTPAEMASKELKEQVSKLEKENLLDHQVAVNQGTETEMFTCGKCKQKKCTYTQLQTRSSDEPMTTFVYCMNCGNRWKFC